MLEEKLERLVKAIGGLDVTLQALARSMGEAQKKAPTVVTQQEQVENQIREMAAENRRQIPNGDPVLESQDDVIQAVSSGPVEAGPVEAGPLRIRVDETVSEVPPPAQRAPWADATADAYEQLKDSPPTLDNIRKAVTVIVAKVGRKEAEALLGSFGAQSVTERDGRTGLKQDQYPEFMTDCIAILKGDPAISYWAKETAKS